MSPIRVIAGIAKGRKLQPVPGDVTRPIGDRVKEALFNIIGPDVRGSRFLDLFAGTGSVGIEALSRGAEYVLFNDQHQASVHTIRENLNRTKLESRAEVIQRDAIALLSSGQQQPFEYIYIAPPQYKQLWLEALQGLEDHPLWMAPDAWVIAQIHPNEYDQKAFMQLVEFDQRKYGNTLLVFYEHPGE